MAQLMSKWSSALEDDINATKKQDKETSASAARYREELESLRSALSGSGEPPADVKHTMDLEEADLREKLRRAWGPDYASTSVAIQELSELGKKRALAYSAANTERVQALEDAVTASRDSTRDFKLEKKKYELAKQRYILDEKTNEERIVPRPNPHTYNVVDPPEEEEPVERGTPIEPPDEPTQEEKWDAIRERNPIVPTGVGPMEPTSPGEGDQQQLDNPSNSATIKRVNEAFRKYGVTEREE